MKQINYYKKIFSVLLCISIFFVYINISIIGSDLHSLECDKEDCSQCFLIYSVQNILRIFMPFGVIILIKNSIEVFYKIVKLKKEIIKFSLVLLKVQFNE